MVSRIKKSFIFLVFIALLIIGFIGGNLFFQGQERYEEAIAEKPIEEAVNEIISKEYFVSYEEIDKDFLNALVSIEDHRFFERKGIDFYSIGRAFVSNLISGKVSQGGSTITQQLAKNIYFSHSKSITRKFAEIFFVYEFEELYSKEEILAMYANIIYYGDGYTGISAASKGYFDKDPNDLSLYEASILAGLPQAPSIYQLSKGYNEINKRQKAVLESMVKNKYITKDEMEETLKLQPK